MVVGETHHFRFNPHFSKSTSWASRSITCTHSFPGLGVETSSKCTVQGPVEIRISWETKSSVKLHVFNRLKPCKSFKNISYPKKKYHHQIDCLKSYVNNIYIYWYNHINNKHHKNQYQKPTHIFHRCTMSKMLLELARWPWPTTTGCAGSIN